MRWKVVARVEEPDRSRVERTLYVVAKDREAAEDTARDKLGPELAEFVDVTEDR